MIIKSLIGVPVAVVISLFLTISVLSQIPKGNPASTLDLDMGGTNYIVGTVFWPTGEPVNTRMSLRLRSDKWGEHTWRTDTEGQFIFASLPEGHYWVVIDGEKDYEPVAEHVEVLQSVVYPKPVYTLLIRLREKPGVSKKATVVNAENANIPNQALAFYNKALELSKSNDNKGAIEQLKLAVTQQPNFMLAFVEMGVQYLKLNELQKAYESLESALKLKPEAYEPLVNSGITLFRMQRFDEAERSLQKAIKVNNGSAVAKFYLGRCLMSLKRFDEAEKMLTDPVVSGPAGMNEAHRILGSLYIETGKDQMAVDELQKYLKLVPAAPDAQKLRATIAQLSAPTTKP